MVQLYTIQSMGDGVNLQCDWASSCYILYAARPTQRENDPVIVALTIDVP